MKVRGQHHAPFTRKLWDCWLKRMNTETKDTHARQLRDGIAQFRALCATREKELI